MLDPFVGRRTLTPEQWKARGEAIQARLQGLSIDELMRGGHGAEAPHVGAHGQRRGGYDPNQPRVPAGHSDGGQWTDDERWAVGVGDGSSDVYVVPCNSLPASHRRLIHAGGGDGSLEKLIEAIHRELA